MEILKSRGALEDYIKKQKSGGKTIGFAPTMGALHAGHISLYEAAAKENDTVVSSIFVNPTQFNNPDDLEKYPRNTEEDIEKLQQSKLVDAVYIPEVADLYPEGTTARHYNFGGLENEMEGRARPGHFDGVGTVVEALFRQVQPDNAYFGEKDFQQLAIIRKLVENENLAVKIHGVPIFREPNGVAMSSRNRRLTGGQLSKAKLLHETLVKVNDWFRIISVEEIYRRVQEIFDAQQDFKLEYFRIADEESLKEAEFYYTGHAYRAFIVAWAGDVRLIDNMDLGRYD